MNLDQLITRLQSNSDFMSCVTDWRILPSTEGSYEPFPSDMDERLKNVLSSKGIHRLYSHQAECWRLAEQEKNYVVVTPTASGKTLCYNLPVVNRILHHPEARALYLFPTKALSSDQVSSLYDMIETLGADIKTYTYDGDTQGAARKAIRQAGHIVVTNPDMLHANILPHHTKWVKLFENLQYIVIDEIHTYRGVFGSHVANVLRRLLRLCDFYGSHPRFILCSATIANPSEHAAKLIGRPVAAVTNNGSPTGERHFVLYNPPIINHQLDIRRSVLGETKHISQIFLLNNIPTIVFCRSRLQVEVIARHLKEIIQEPIGYSGRVRGYRGGYLPSERHEIEKGLRNGSINMVVSTNALELGIDIGSLSVCVLCGYPGTIASSWQQAGRAGRQKDTSLTILIASSTALDQYIIQHPNYFFHASPENALIAPDNLYILMSHIKCAAYELPFAEGEKFGNVPDTSQFLDYLTENHILRRLDDKYYWMEEDLPSGEISLRSAKTDNFVIIDITDPSHHRVIGEMDRFTVPMLLHEKAIYLHDTKMYQVEKLDLDNCKAFIRSVDADYYTDADLNISLHILDDMEHKTLSSGIDVVLGELRVSSIVKMFKKFKLDTNENVGLGEVRLPQTDLHTVGIWWSVSEHIALQYSPEDLQCALLGISHLLSISAPLYLMCSSRDIQVIYQTRAPITNRPTIFMYDNFPGGVGLSEKAYQIQDILLSRSLEIVKSCHCEYGCPSCVGAPIEMGLRGKSSAIKLLEEMIG